MTCAALRLNDQEERKRFVATFHLREARSKGHLGMKRWLSFSFVPPFLILEQMSYFIRGNRLCQEMTRSLVPNK
jgi:hypothetical protein